MKKTLSLLMALLLCLGLCACGGNKSADHGGGNLPTGNGGASSTNATTGTEGQKHEHDYLETDRVNPSKSEDGSVTYTCIFCDDFYIEVLPATGSDHLSIVSKNGAYIVTGWTSLVSDSELYIPTYYQGVEVTGIGPSAFKGISGANLTKVVISNSVTFIDGFAFSDCAKLTTVIIGSGVTSIAHSVFSRCSNLTSITIPDNVTSMGDYVFYCCYKLERVVLPNGITSIGNGMFENCYALTSICFDGTMEQWESIAKGEDWDSGTGNYTIYCTDGEITK